jgi:EmrB/QacA subfamily drug resistance transporter
MSDQPTATVTAIDGAKAAPDSSAKIPPAARGVLAITALGSFMAFLDATIVNIAFPSIEKAFPDSSIEGVSWILNAYAIVFAALLVPAGRLGDVIGRRRVFIGGLAIFTVASATAAAANSVEMLVASRIVQAAGGAALVPTSLALLLPAFPLERRGMAVGLWGAAAAAAAASGPPLGGLLTDQASWRWVFLVNVPIGIVTIVAARLHLAESRDPEARTLPDLIGAVLISATAALIALGLVKGGDWGWANERTVGAFAAAAALLPLFVARSRRHDAPVLDLELFRVRSFAIANAATLAWGTAFYGMILANVLFLTSVWGYSVLTAGLAVLPAPVMATVFAGPAGRLSDRFGAKPVVMVGTTIFIAGLALFATQTTATPQYVSVWLPAATLAGIGVGIGYATLGAAAAAALGPADFGAGSAVNAMGRQLGAVLGFAVVIAIVGTPSPQDALTAFHHAWEFVAGAAVVSLALASAMGGETTAVAAHAHDREAVPASAPLAA